MALWLAAPFGRMVGRVVGLVRGLSVEVWKLINGPLCRSGQRRTRLPARTEGDAETHGAPAPPRDAETGRTRH
jgi:hypothetical protein